MKNDQSGTKVDFFTVLKRRKKTVESFLRENGLKDIKELKKYILANYQDMFLSDDFLKEANEYFAGSLTEKLPLATEEKNDGRVQTKRHNKKLGA